MIDSIEKKEKTKAFLLEKNQSGGLEEVFSLMKELLIGYSAVDNPGRSSFVYRLRPNEDNTETERFKTVSDFWFPNSPPINRLNWPEEPVLYCSSDMDTCFLEGRVKDGDSVAICKFAVRNEQFRSINLGFRSDSSFTCQTQKINWGDYRRSKLSKTKVDIKTNEYIDEFLFDVFTEPTTQFYKISSSVGKMYLHNDQGSSLDAISYPSVKRLGRGPGVNWAFSPQFAVENIVPTEFYKYVIKQGKPSLIASAEYRQDHLSLNAEIEWHS